MKVELETGPGTLDIITVDGIAISLDLLKALANPDPKRLYHMERQNRPSYAGRPSYETTVVTMVGERT